MMFVDGVASFVVMGQCFLGVEGNSLAMVYG